MGKRTAEPIEKEQERDNLIEEPCNRFLELCNKEGKEIFKEYVNEVAYRESDDSDFYYLIGLKKMNIS